MGGLVFIVACQRLHGNQRAVCDWLLECVDWHLWSCMALHSGWYHRDTFRELLRSKVLKEKNIYIYTYIYTYILFVHVCILNDTAVSAGSESTRYTL